MKCSPTSAAGAVVLILGVGSASAQFDDIAGYTPVSNVVPHSELDLDTAEVETCADTFNWTCAYRWYSEGGNSVKLGSNTTRTLRGFSTDADGKLTGERWYDIYQAYWDDAAYADTFTGGACQGTGDFAGASDITRSECCLKGAQYQNVWMYVIHELEDATSDCVAGDLEANDGGPHAWDEGWAFYAGSLEGTEGTGDGQHIYALAQKRCANFGTCTGDSDGVSYEGTAAVNTQLLDLYHEGQEKLLEGACADVVSIKDQIVDLMTVPLIQGMLRYFYLADPVAYPTTTDKEAAELWAFSAAALPRISECDATVAATVKSNTDINSASAPMSDGYEVLKGQLETVYSCLGFTCADVGGYFDDEEAGTYVSGMEPCTDADDSSTSYAEIAGYMPVSDVVPHSELDLDTAEMEKCADTSDWDCAYHWYSEGGHSVKQGSGDIRTLQGFSTGAEEKLTGEKWYEIYKAYWNDDAAYADTFTGGACRGTGDFEGASDLTRSECCLKGAQYQNVWMYVIHELEDATSDCIAGDLEANDGGPHAWDEGWAFYAGSLEGTEGTGDGQHIYALAQKRCANFGTCTGDSDGVSYEGTAAVNTQLLDLYHEGQEKLLEGACADVVSIKDQIVDLMTVPLIQGMLRYFYLADPVAYPTTTDKEAAELWAFSAAALPRISECDATVAATVKSNTDINSASAPMSDGYEVLKGQLETVYSCLGFTCADVGGYFDDEEAGTYVSGMEPCTDADDSSTSYAGIAGYTPVSDVVPHSELDLDTAEMEKCADASDWDCAYHWYSEGGHSVKQGSGDIRTLQGFSTSAQEKLTGEKWYDIYKAYWNDDAAYADTFTGGACRGTGDFEGASDLTRSECCLKGAQYQNVWMYVIHELEDATSDCIAGDLEANDGGPHAWDEGWAFYAGSLEGTEGTGDGQHIYALAQKRCANFGTCTGDSDGVSYEGTAAVNTQLLDLYHEGQEKLLEGACADVVSIKDQIVDLMTVPLIQGMLRYFYLADPVAYPTTTDKEAAELWAFSAAALPRISECDATVAATVKSNTDINSASAPMSDGYEVLKGQLETVYSCLGFTCADVGGYFDDEEAGTYVSGMEPCTDADDSSTSYAGIAGYTPVSDVVPHSELDLDTAEMEKCADASDWDCAYHWYSEGGHSVKQGSGDIRTLQGFSTSAQEKLTGEKWYDIYKAYWNDDAAYADTFTGGACRGTGDFEGASDLTRSECCLKGAQYQNVWMYVIHELEDAISDCSAGDLEANDGGPHAWDEGWAFYAGSLEGTEGTGDGQHIYALAQKRCANFGTCTGDSDGVSYEGTAAVNTQLLDLYHEGQEKLLEGACADVVSIKDQIVDLMTVPLIQGMLRYFYLADPVASPDATDKEAAELWAFSAAALPRISECDATVAETIKSNTDINSASAPMSDGYEVLKGQLETVYSCLGFTCADVGGYLDDAEAGTYLSGMDPCTDNGGEEQLPEWGLALIFIAAAGVVGVIIFFCFRRRSRKSTENMATDGLGGFGVKAESTI